MPPCSAVSSTAIDRPSPVPPRVLARAGSARQKRLNTRTSSPGLRPTPWSRTVKRDRVVADAPTRDLDVACPAPYSIALTTRLRTIRSIRRTSTSADRRLVVGRRPGCVEPALVGERRGRLDDPARDVREVDVGQLEHRRAGVEPADLEQVGQQQLEPVELHLEQLGRARGRRVEVDRARRTARRRPSARWSAACAARG